MTNEVKIPDIGNFSEIPVVTVLVSVGDFVEAQDPILELESDKATMDVPSSATGFVKEIKVNEGDLVTEGTLVLLLADSKAGAIEKTEAPAAPVVEQVTTPSISGYATPSMRARARQMDVDPSQIYGTLGSLSSGNNSTSGNTSGVDIPPIPAVNFSKLGPIESIEMPRIKKLSGPALHRSWLNIPHVTHNEEADITDLDPFRRELDGLAKSEGYRVTLLSFVIKASVSALKTHWEVNSSLHPDGDKLIKKCFYNIGFAADTPNGLVVPVIKNADTKGIIEISKELGELSSRARDGKLKSQDMSGATFTISSLGGIGGTSFTPIVNAPEVAILGLTRSRMAPVWNGESFIPRSMQPLSLSYDHRAIDGALAARFCATLKHLLGDVRRLML